MCETHLVFESCFDISCSMHDIRFGLVCPLYVLWLCGGFCFGSTLDHAAKHRAWTKMKQFVILMTARLEWLLKI